ncbi:MAG: hypothetical protein JO030_03180 [Candidatus Eremiobacteraeota bacterium]|nr:hypothetical protein [Candidatus Eremiobacteraeota bacterium]
MLRIRLGALVMLAALAACSGGNESKGGNPSPKATNAIAFPLFEGANVLSTRSWRTTIRSSPGLADRSVFTQGAGTYAGHDVVAGTQAMMPALETWLADLSAQPPAGYSVALRGNGIDAVRAHTRDLGLDFVPFESSQNGKRHGVVVIAVDPGTLGDKAGPMLGLVGKFKLMPSTLRDPLDAQAKRQLGFSLSEAANPDTPIGAAVAALDQLRDFGGRGIVLIDAVKQ